MEYLKSNIDGTIYYENGVNLYRRVDNGQDYEPACFSTGELDRISEKSAMFEFIKTIRQLQAIKKHHLNRLVERSQEIHRLKDKLHHRNMQIKDLKIQLEAAQEAREDGALEGLRE